MQEIKLNLSPCVIKFLNAHLDRNNPDLLIRSSYIKKMLLMCVRKAPANHKPEADYNFVIVFKDDRNLRDRLGVDIRSERYFIPKTSQKYIDVFFRQFINDYFCMWMIQNSTEKYKEVDMINTFKKMFDFSEDDITSHSLHMAYWRFRKEFEKPLDFFVKYFTSSFVLGQDCVVPKPNARPWKRKKERIPLPKMPELFD